MFVIFTQISTQRAEFVDYLLDLQFLTEPLYRSMMSFFAASRARMSTLLVGMNDEGVLQVTGGAFEDDEKKLFLTFLI